MIFQFAWRYFKGKKSTQAVQIISWVSVFAMAIGTAAIIIVLSVFNGFETFIKDLYSDFYPQIKITAKQGKTFARNTNYLFQLTHINGMQSVSETLEEKVLLNYHENQVIVTLKGIDDHYNEVSKISEKVRYGTMDFSTASEIPPILLGIGISNTLGASESSPLPITCYAFNQQASGFNDIGNAYFSSLFEVKGVYVLQDEIDNQYAFTPLSVLQELVQKPTQISALEISLTQDADEESICKQIAALPYSKQLKIETRYEQNKTLYFILKSERWAVFAILVLMLVIASFNIVGCMSMLVMDKEKDIAILKTMGMQTIHVKQIFIVTGIILSVIGAFIGSAIAILICWLQQHFGFVKLGSSDAFLIDAYPVKMQLSDFVIVMLTVILIATLASLYPAIKASKKAIELRVK
ncbi:MAG: ABC transporter permease [Bacteroidetes bacterium]|nr:ABC transporter permease [Bacteroidota bacterium]